MILTSKYIINLVFVERSRKWQHISRGTHCVSNGWYVKHRKRYRMLASRIIRYILCLHFYFIQTLKICSFARLVFSFLLLLVINVVTNILTPIQLISSFVCVCVCVCVTDSCVFLCDLFLACLFVCVHACFAVHTQTHPHPLTPTYIYIYIYI